MLVLPTTFCSDNCLDWSNKPLSSSAPPRSACRYKFPSDLLVHEVVLELLIVEQLSYLLQFAWRFLKSTSIVRINNKWNDGMQVEKHQQTSSWKFQGAQLWLQLRWTGQCSRPCSCLTQPWHNAALQSSRLTPWRDPCSIRHAGRGAYDSEIVFVRSREQSKQALMVLFTSSHTRSTQKRSRKWLMVLATPLWNMQLCTSLTFMKWWLVGRIIGCFTSTSTLRVWSLPWTQSVPASSTYGCNKHSLECWGKVRFFSRREYSSEKTSFYVCRIQ